APPNATSQVGRPVQLCVKNPTSVAVRTTTLAAIRRASRAPRGRGGGTTYERGIERRKTTSSPANVTKMLASAGRNIQRAYSANEILKRLATTMLIGLLVTSAPTRFAT